MKTPLRHFPVTSDGLAPPRADSPAPTRLAAAALRLTIKARGHEWHRFGVPAASSAGFRASGFTVLSSTVYRTALGTGKSPEPADRNVCATTLGRMPTARLAEKTFFRSGLVLFALLVMLLTVSVRLTSAAEGVNELLQKGLFEEEANHNLDAAIKAYQSVITQQDDQRKLAATAVFRLGECYRKLGRTNEATAQYERILRDFADQPSLAALSRQYLGEAASATSPSMRGVNGAQATERKLIELRAEYDQARTLNAM